MNWSNAHLLAGLLSAPLLTVPAEVIAADYGHGRGCYRADQVHIRDLDMSPDPLAEGRRVQSWKVTLQFDGNRECGTEISVRESGYIVAQPRRIDLHPGLNDIDLRPAENYRFRGGEHCFTVEADLAGSRRAVDAARRFCAEQKFYWSLRESAGRDHRDR